MFDRWLFVWTFLMVSAVTKAEFDYCSITKKHTMCQYQGFGDKCGSVLGNGITNQDIKDILRVHNELRAKIANGLEKRGKPGPQPPASNMEEMEWDDELAQVAQRHADQCVFAHDCSQCRKIPRFLVGQNLYIYKQSRKSAATNWERAITDWYNEVELFGKERVKPFRFSTDVGHYTAMVWSNTNKVGCGVTEFIDGKWFAKLYTCNYGPAGNYIGGEMYEAGRACSNCPKGTSCSSSYPGLCASDSSTNEVIPRQNNPVTTPRPTTTSRTTPRPTTTTTRRTTPATTTTAKPFVPSNSNRFSPPNSRPIQKTTTRRPVAIATTTPAGVDFRNISAGNIFQCTFARNSAEACEVKFSGKDWLPYNSATDQFYEIVLESGERSEIFFSNMVSPPVNGIACLSFRYRKFLDNGDNAPLQVVAWPYNGRPGKVNVMRSSPNPATWIRAQVTFRKVDNFFVVLFRAVAPQKDNMYLAIDDVTVTNGSCN